MTAELPPFTPSLDWVRAKVGRTSADVYGAVLRYCQMGEGVCRAGLESIAQRAGVCRRTAITHLGRLVEFGLLVDETPNLRNHPHRYTVAECKPCTVQELHSAIPAPPQCKNCTMVVQELHLKRETIQETKKIPPPPPRICPTFPGWTASWTPFLGKSRATRLRPSRSSRTHSPPVQ